MKAERRAATDSDIPADDGPAPWTVLAYAPVSLLWTVIYSITEGTGFPIGPTIMIVVIDVALGYGMYRRRKAAWTIALILMALPILGLGNSFIDSGFAAGMRDVIGIAALLYVLLHPDTRGWCSEVREPMKRP